MTTTNTVPRRKRAPVSAQRLTTVGPIAEALRLDEAGLRMGVSAKTVRRMAMRGALAYTRVGSAGAMRIPLQAIDAYFSARLVSRQ